MTDHIPADKLRERINEMRETAKMRLPENVSAATAQAMLNTAADRMEELLTPPLPTLADMTPEEREKCQWMWGKTKTGRIVLIGLIGGDRCKCHFPDGGHSFFGLDYITPLPDLPKLRWPGSEPDVSKSAPDQVVAKDVCNKEPQTHEMWVVLIEGREQYAQRFTDGWDVDRYGEIEDCDTLYSVKPVVRLVPESPCKTLVTVEDYRDAPVGTVVHEHTGVREKTDRDTWEGHRRSWFSNSGMADTPRVVIWEPES